MKQLLIGIYGLVVLGIAVVLGVIVMQDAPENAGPGSGSGVGSGSGTGAGAGAGAGYVEIPAEVDTELDQATIEVINEVGKSRQVSVKNLDLALPKYEVPWKRFAAQFPADSGKPRIAIVIDDLGLNPKASNQLSYMVGPLTLAYLPYAENLARQTGLVRQAGHELLVHLPMEPAAGKSNDPGPDALLAGLSDVEFDRRLDSNLRKFNGFVGINNHMGSGLTANGPKMVRVLHYLKKEGFLFLDSLTTPKTKGIAIAKRMGVPYLQRDIFLDNDRNVESIARQFQKLEKIATSRGYAVGIGHPYPETLAELKLWLARAKNAGFEIVPISALVKVPTTEFSSKQVFEEFSGN